MSDLEYYIVRRKARDKNFAFNFDKDYKEFKEKVAAALGKHIRISMA